MEKNPVTNVSSTTFSSRTDRLPNAMEHLASRSHYHKGDTIYYQAGPAEFCYRIESGAARECTLLADGRRQVVGFLMPGDMSGFCAPEVHRFSGEIIADSTTVARYPRHWVERLAESDPEVGRRFRQLALDAIDRLQVRMSLLARPTALERVSTFLLEMADRCAPSAEHVIELPMSRYDIADYLALSVETVSRTLTSLRRRRLIALPSARRVTILSRERLEWCSDNNAPRMATEALSVDPYQCTLRRTRAM
jgi:CRP-like cAMP-binding protein